MMRKLIDSLLHPVLQPEEGEDPHPHQVDQTALFVFYQIHQTYVSEFDGDTFNGEEFDILDPTPTDWNRLSTRPGSIDRSNQRDSPSSNQAPGSLLHQLDLERRSRAIPSFPPSGVSFSGSPSSSLDTPERNNVRLRTTPTSSVGRGGHLRPGLAGSVTVGSGGGQQVERRENEGHPSQETVTIYDESGFSVVAPVVPGRINNNPQVNKTRKKKVNHLNIISNIFFYIFLQETNAEAGSKYFSRMLVMQSSMMKLRRKYIRSKLRTEQLKQALLKKSFSDNDIMLPELEPSSESESSNGEDEEEEDDGNIFN